MTTGGEETSGPNDPFVGTLFAGRFHVQRPLSRGGMGSVYVAQQWPAGRLVALKVIRDDVIRNPEFGVRFTREAQALALISHPNIVTFLDSGVENGNPFLVMELLQGRTLREELDRVGAVAWQRAVKIAVDICRGLAALHRRGIIHRDLKPDNVFLQESEGHDDFVKLIDLGVVRIASDSVKTETGLTGTGIAPGTPGYMSPEQLRSQPATHLSDLYAVGVLLYEAVTGRFPFAANDMSAMFVKQLIDPVTPPEKFTPSLPAHVSAAILQLMEREPARRPQSAEETVRLLAPLIHAAEHTPARGIPRPGPTPATVSVPVSNSGPRQPRPKERSGDWRPPDHGRKVRWALIAGAALAMGGAGVAWQQQARRDAEARASSQAGIPTQAPPAQVDSAPTNTPAPSNQAPPPGNGAADPSKPSGSAVVPDDDTGAATASQRGGSAPPAASIDEAGYRNQVQASATNWARTCGEGQKRAADMTVRLRVSPEGTTSQIFLDGADSATSVCVRKQLRYVTVPPPGVQLDVEFPLHIAPVASTSSRASPPRQTRQDAPRRSDNARPPEAAAPKPTPSSSLERPD